MTKKERATERLHKAVAHWVNVYGGTAVVTSGPEVQDWREGQYKYRIALRVVGIAPKREVAGE